MAKTETDQKLNTIIGQGSIVSGDMDVQGGLRIDGRVDGKIAATGPLTVGREGIIHAPSVSASSATIGGSIEGNITAPEGIHLEPSARIKGNMITKLLIIEEGAIFTGSSDMTTDNDS